jgi:prolyl 4-hydroxylase
VEVQTGPESLWITVGEHARNGQTYQREDPEGVNLTLSRGFGVNETTNKSFCALVRQKANLLHKEPTAELSEECRLWSVTGKEAVQYSDLVPEMAYYTFPLKRPFVWPTVALGHRVAVPFHKDDERAGTDSKGVVLETISLSPRVFRLHNFVSDAETDAMMARAKKLGLERSTGGLQKQGKEGENQGEQIADRTSTNAWDTSSPLAIKIKKRAFEILRMVYVDDWSDGLQVVKYEPSQFYNSHTDWFDLGASPNWNWDPARGGVNRFATVFLYLNDVELGGETVFPKSTQTMPANDYRVDDFNRIVDELLPINGTAHKLAHLCRTGFRVPPKRGDAILFYNQLPGGAVDHASLHGACPVIEGEKWGANLWIWNAQCWTPEREPGYFDEKIPRADARQGAFTNTLPTKVDSYWLKHNEDEDYLGPIEAGDVYSTNSFIGHTFVFKAGTREVGRYTMTRAKETQAYQIVDAEVKKADL